MSLVKHIGNIEIEFHDGLRNRVNYIANSRRILKFVDSKKKNQNKHVLHWLNTR